MLPDAVAQSLVLGPVFALGILALFLLLAALANIALRMLLKLRKARHEVGQESLELEIFEAIQGPLVLTLILAGFFLGFLSLTQVGNPLFDAVRASSDWARKVWLVAIVIQVGYVVSHVLQALLRWYVHKSSQDARTVLDTKLGPTIDRLLPIIVYSVGALVALDIIGIPISPLLAGLGIGGLAVALALTPTISSFIAGTYIVTEGQIKEGDFIEIEGQTSGWVMSVGWRSTVIRSFTNNIVIIPNSKITDSIVTNYTTPTPIVTTLVENGVSYDSDLKYVEYVALEVAQEVVDHSEFAVKTFVPIVLFREFADSNINFRVIVQATDRFGSFRIRSEIIKSLHERFKAEGIEINYPVRKLVLPTEDGYLPVRNMDDRDSRRTNGVDAHDVVPPNSEAR
ncbi:MAG: mechanosensitive ion channel family protein [Chloroflexi bacterium]|nr:mechanosensitive ion channel family protein [Chloroflexota bacterium]MDA1227047.1 mechanosensitive ion channel family protein [Chloroflexota bacterium]